MFPISLYIPHEYPRGVPIAYATPTANMVVRAGQYVSGEGRIYHPYLAGWSAEVSPEGFTYTHWTAVRLEEELGSIVGGALWVELTKDIC